MRQVLSIIFTLMSIIGHTQNIVTGRVIDVKTQEPVSYAVIGAKNDLNPVIADANGLFRLNVNSDSVELIVTGIGYERSRNRYATGNNITIQLNKGVLNLKELVVYSGINTNTNGNTISKIDLHIRPVQSSQELLRNVPGLFIAQHQGGGKAEQIFLRGFDIDHGTDINISVDGLPVNLVSHAHGQGYADLHFLIPELVKAIDYGKGPYFTSYGNLATAGYVQFETRSVLEKGTVQLERGMFNNTRALAMVPLLKRKNQDAYIASEILYNDGPFDQPQHFNRFNVHSRYNIRLNEKVKIGIIATWLNSKWNASGQLPQRAVDAGTVGRFGEIDHESGYTDRFNIAIKSQQALGKNSQLENQAYFVQTQFNLYSNFTFFLNDTVNGDQIRQREKRNILGWQSKYTTRYYLGETRYVTTLGAGIRQDRTTGSELSHTKDRTQLVEQKQFGNIRENNSWLYAEQQVNPGRLLFTLGIRADHFRFAYTDILTKSNQEQTKSILSPKASLQYNFSRQLQLYLKTGKGFHSNDTRVVLDNSANKILPAVYGTDLGLIWKPVPALLVNAAVWSLRSQQEFVYVGDEGVVEASGASRRKGIDLSFRYQLSSHFFADADFTWSRSRTSDLPTGENYVPLAPRFTNTGGIHYQSKKGFSGSLRYRWLKDRPANEDGSITARGYFVADAVLNYAFKKYELGLVTENLFNTKWNEAQFATTSRLRSESLPVTELHFTPGIPFFAKVRAAIFF